jgi:hypothetical protein
MTILVVKQSDGTLAILTTRTNRLLSKNLTESQTRDILVNQYGFGVRSAMKKIEDSNKPEDQFPQKE